MNKLAVLFVLISGFFTIITAFQYKADFSENWSENTNLYEVLFDLGEAKPKHFLVPTKEQIQKGEEIVKQGYTTDFKGRRTSRVSKHYVCTTCHNLQREDPILTISDPETRLPYVKEQGMPLLQGTTFWGIVNRESWYNDDYVKKYGDKKIETAHKDLRESIQLCAIECSQGRPMKPWEIDVVLAYYWNLQLKMNDLDLTKADWKKLQSAKGQGGKNEALITWLKKKYALKSPATFFDAPSSKTKGYEGLTGRPDVGKDVYELSCLHCHKPYGVSHYVLDNSGFSFKHLDRMIPKDSHFSLYQIIAYGTYAIPGHRPYMPHYPLERLSKQQVEDLRAYIEQQATN